MFENIFMCICSFLVGMLISFYLSALDKDEQLFIFSIIISFSLILSLFFIMCNHYVNN